MIDDALANVLGKEGMLAAAEICNTAMEMAARLANGARKEFENETNIALKVAVLHAVLAWDAAVLQCSLAAAEWLLLADESTGRVTPTRIIALPGVWNEANNATEHVEYLRRQQYMKRAQQGKVS